MVKAPTIEFQANTSELAQAVVALRDIVGAAGGAGASADELNAAYKKLDAAVSQVEKQFKDTNAAISATKSSSTTATTAINTLRAAYDPLYANTKKYEIEKDRLDQGFAAGSISIDTYTGALRQLDAQLASGTIRSQTFNAAMNRNANQVAKASSVMNAHSGNMFAQLNDISMMAMSGQNALVLTMQQGTQVAQIMNQVAQSGGSMTDAVVGGLKSMLSPITLVTMGVVALSTVGIQALMSMGGEAKSITDSLNDMVNAMSEFEKMVSKAAMSPRKMADEFGRMSPVLQQVYRDLAAIKGIELHKSIIEASDALKDLVNDRSWSDSWTGPQRAAELFGVLVTKQTALGGVLKLNSAENNRAIADLQKMLVVMSNGETAAKRMQSAIELRDLLRENTGGIESMNDAQLEVYSTLTRIIEQYELAGIAAEKLSNAAPMFDEKDVSNANDMLASIQAQSVVYGLIAKYGEDSRQVAAAKAQIERDELSSKLSQLDVSTALKDEIMAAFEAQQNASDAADETKKSLRDAADAARDLSSAIQGFEAGLETTNRLLNVEIAAIREGRDVSIAAARERMSIKAQEIQQSSIAAGVDANLAAARYAADIAAIDANVSLLEQKQLLVDANKNVTKSVNEAQKAYERLMNEGKKLTEQMRTPLEKHNAEIERLQELYEAGAIGAETYQRASKKAFDDLSKQIPLVDDLAKAFGDFAVSTEKDFDKLADNLVASVKSMIADMIATVARNKIMVSLGYNVAGGALSGAAGGVASGVAQSAVAGGAGSGMLGGFFGSMGANVLSGSFTAGTGLFGGLGASMNAAFGAGGSLTNMFAVSANAAAAGGGFAATLGAAVPVIAVAVLAYSFLKKKTKTIGSGLQFTVNEFDAAVKSFETIQTKRFWGLSKKVRTNWKDLSDAAAEPYIHAISMVQQSVLASANALGIADSAFSSFSHTVKVSTHGLSEAEAQKAIEKAFNDMSDAMAGMVAGLDEFALYGETSSQTLTRLSTSLTAVNSTFEYMNKAMFDVSVAGGGLAASLAGMFGDLQTFQALHQSYIQGFYSEQEQLDMATASLQRQFASLSLTMPATAKEFRKLVESADLQTVAGQELYAALLKMAPEFKATLDGQDQIKSNMDQIKSNILGAIESAMDSLQQMSVSGIEMQREAAQRIVSEAIQSGQAVEDQFTKAVAVLGNLDKSMFESRTDYNRERSRNLFLLSEAHSAFGGSEGVVLSQGPGAQSVVRGNDSVGRNKKIEVLLEELVISARSNSGYAKKANQILNTWDRDGIPGERIV